MEFKELKDIYLFWLSRNLNRAFIKPDYVGILLTKRCNLKCKMCDIRNHPTRPEEEISFGDVKKVVDETARWGVKNMVLSGGEPFLRKDFFEIADYTIKNIPHTAINTNLTLMDEGMALKLIELPRNKFHLEISLDGAAAKTHDSIRGVSGSFDKIMNNIKLIRAASKSKNALNIHIGVTSVLMKENLKEAMDLVYLAKSMNFVNVSFMPVMSDNVNLDIRDDKYIMSAKEIKILNLVIGELLDFKKKNGLIINPDFSLKLYPKYFKGEIKKSTTGCYAGFIGPNICPDGEVFICKHLIGDVNKADIKNIWYSRKANHVRRMAYSCKSPCLQHYAVRCDIEASPFAATYRYLKERKKERLLSMQKEEHGADVNFIKIKKSKKAVNKKFKIILSDTARLYPPLWGGPRRIWHLFSNLKKDLFDMTYVGVDYGLPNGNIYKFNRIEENFREIIFGFPKHYYPWHFLEKKIVRNSALDLFSYLYMHTHRDFKDIFNTLEADILVCSHPWSSLSMNKRKDQLFIYDAHNCEYLLMEQILDNHILKPFILKKVKDSEWDACQKADIIIVCSDSEKKQFIDIYDVKPSKLYVIPNGSYARPAIAEEDKKNARKELSIGLDKEVLIFIGAHYKPNIDATRFILEMLAPELPEFIFLIAGSVINEFKSLNIPSNIKFLGQVSDEKLLSALKSADIALNPMFTGSGSNIKMLDYMSCGLPIITTECGSRGLDVDGRRPMVISSIAKFTDNIRSLSGDSGLYKKMSEDARAVVSEKYDWKKISDRLQSIILEKLR